MKTAGEKGSGIGGFKETTEPRLRLGGSIARVYMDFHLSGARKNYRHIGARRFWGGSAKGECKVRLLKLPDNGMIKKQSSVALFLFLLIPVITVLGGVASSMINPEWAAGHPDYARNFLLLNLLKNLLFFGSMAGVGALWMLVCFLVIRSKKRSYLWLFLAALGPLGFAVLASLNDRTAAEPDSYTRFLRKMNWIVRAGYEVLSFLIIWELAWQAMILKSTLMVRYESITTGVSIAQINAVRDASSGMWAFGEGMEVMYFAILLYLLRPFLFRLVASVLARGSTKAS